MRLYYPNTFHGCQSSTTARAGALVQSFMEGAQKLHAQKRSMRRASFATEALLTSNCKTNEHFSIQNHHFSGAILHYLCIFGGKFKIF